ncbi:hypothetical protein [Apilactobacillus timberlakei]|nr:hypothetical protein [Apilactobacillus timberlakei]
MEILSGIIGVLLTLFISPIFTRKNNEQNSLHSESVWREKLFNLSCNTSINARDLELFRTFLSATRGIENQYFDRKKYPLDFRMNERKQDLDDTCLHYYYFLKNKYSYELDRNMCIKTYKYTFIFNQLCRLLLKSDWNKRITSSEPFHFLQCIERYTEMEIKAILIINNNMSKLEIKNLKLSSM